MAMKHKLALTISLAMIVALASLMRSDSTASAQQRRVFRGDTGVVPLGSHQVLRITVDWGDGDPGTVRFGRIAYMPEGCNSDGVCKLAVAAQDTSEPITLMRGEAASMDYRETDFNFVRRVVLSSSRNVRVNAQIIDVTTGQVDGIIAILIAN